MNQNDCLYPLQLVPAFQDYLWGGTKLREVYHKAAPAEWQNVAEAWEVSTHPHGLSTIANGKFAGQTLQTYLELAGPKVLGKRFTQANLPILVKIIDAADNLSIQVHPFDDYARKYENSPGKTEMWYVLDADEKAFIYYGFKKIISADEFERRIKDNTLLSVLRKVKLSKGDVFMIPAGTIHAIGKGLLVLEVQQCCDLTYRVYDYARRDKDGNLRELHIEKALDVTHLGPAPKRKIAPVIPLYADANIQTLVTFKDFVVKRLIVAEKIKLLSLPDTYQVLFVSQGELQLHYQNSVLPVKTFQSIFMPANMGEYYLQGQGEVLLITDN